MLRCLLLLQCWPESPQISFPVHTAIVPRLSCGFEDHSRLSDLQQIGGAIIQRSVVLLASAEKLSFKIRLAFAFVNILHTCVIYSFEIIANNILSILELHKVYWEHDTLGNGAVFRNQSEMSHKRSDLPLKWTNSVLFSLAVFVAKIRILQTNKYK